MDILCLPASQRNAQRGDSPIAKKQTQPPSHYRDWEDHARGGVAEIPHAVAHKYLIHNVVETGDNERADAGNRKLPQQFSHFFRTKIITVFHKSSFNLRKKRHLQHPYRNQIYARRATCVVDSAPFSPIAFNCLYNYLLCFNFSNIADTLGCVSVNFTPRFSIPITLFAFCSISLTVCSLVNIR